MAKEVMTVVTVLLNYQIDDVKRRDSPNNDQFERMYGK
jgi:hypothetical protein